MSDEWVGMTHKRHRWIVCCDCRDHPAEDERDCCCVGGDVCWRAPIRLCRCGERSA